MKYCEYGCGQEAKFQFKNGKLCCSISSNKCLKKRETDSLKKIGKTPNWKNGHPKPWLGKTTNRKGKTFIEIFGEKKSKEIKEKISKSMRSLHLSGMASTKEKEEERRRRIKEKAKMNNGGYRKGSGVGKCGWYKGFWCDSSYELAYVIYCLENSVPIKRNFEKFPYLYQGKTYQFIPDFISNNTYIEIKGYLDKQNLQKISQFKHKLKVITHPEIDPILKYVKEKHGSKFIELYERRGGQYGDKRP